MKRKFSEKKPKNLRVHRISFLLNTDEQKTINRYLAKYHIENKSRWYRETILTHILKTLNEDYPTLFKETEMRR